MKTNITFLISLFLFTGIFTRADAQCIPSGTITAAGFANETNIGLISWTNAMNAYTSDNMRSCATSMVGMLSAVSTNYLTAKNFNLFVPGSAFVCGIQVNVEHRQNGGASGYSVRDNVVQLVKGNTLLGVNRASSIDWGPTDETYTYGGPNDMWGGNLTPGDLNSPNFGVVFSATLRGGLSSSLVTAEVDAITLTLYYTTILPVEFTLFEANVKGAGIGLEWKTATETNSGYFAIERSTDAKTFKDIGVVKAAGNSLQTLDYSFTDESPLAGTAYYRIRQVDNNGNANLSEMRAVDYTRSACVTSASASHGQIIVKLYSPGETMAELEVSGLNGQRVAAIKTELQPGTTELRMNAETAESGVYFVKARMANSEYYHKLYLLRD